MQRWAIRVAQLVSLLWAAFFLTANLLHPRTHNPLQPESSDCFVCVLHQTASTEPHTPSATPQPLLLASVHASVPLEPTVWLETTPVRPRIPRAPPA